jgi:hypothetical protein
MAGSQASEHSAEVLRLNKLLMALELATHGNANALLEEDVELTPAEQAKVAAAAASTRRGKGDTLAKVSLTEIKMQLQRQIKIQVSRIWVGGLEWGGPQAATGATGCRACLDDSTCVELLVELLVLGDLFCTACLAASTEGHSVILLL